MSDFAKLFENMVAQGTKMAKDFDPKSSAFSLDKLTDLFPKMGAETMEQVFGKTFNPEGLDARTRLLALLAAQVVSGADGKEPQIKLTVQNALEAGAKQQEVTEVILQSAVYGGVPSMTKAITVAQSVFEDRKADT